MTAAPNFYLYGEPHRRVEDGFVHAESLDTRSRPSGWTIRPHAHAELAHIFFLSAGGGAVRMGDGRYECRAPCLLLVPARSVHGFDWIAESRGDVLSLATRRLSALAWMAPEAAGLLDRFGMVRLSPGDAAIIDGHLREITRELGWSRIGHDMAVQAALMAILVLALRLGGTAPARPGDRHGAVVARLRARIDERFRLREPVGVYAAALGTSETALRVACACVADSSPAAMLDQRTLLEARRALLFSDRSIGEVAFSLGFEDAAYFSRFFTRHMGRSPRRYRLEQPPA